MDGKQKVNVLMVDDQPAKLLSYEAMLAELGENLIRATSASEALDNLLKHEIAVVLCDVNMPELDGFELVDTIRKHPRFETVAVIFVSAVHLSNLDRLKGYRHGAVDYVTVPVVPEILRAKVRVFVDLYRKSKALENVNAQLEERIAERTTALAASEERFRLATEAMSGGLYDWNVETDDWWSSAGLMALLGSGSGQAESSRQWWQAQIHPDDLEGGWKAMEDALASSVPAFDVQYRVRYRKEHWTWIWDRGRIVRDAAGLPVRVVGHVTDISAQKVAEEALRQEHQRKDEFLATLSHELRNPLAPIRNALELMRLRRESGAKANPELAVIERHVDQLRRLVDDLLDVTRISNNSLTLRAERTDLVEAVNGALEAARPLIDERGQTLTLALPESLPLSGDLVRLTQVVTNLLNNSAKYTPAGGRIWLTVSARDGEALLSVKDTGRGIDPRDQSNLFRMFFRAGDTSQYDSDGLGVGLALVAKIVEMHGGRIEASSGGVDAGSEFIVRLPLRPQLAERTAVAKTALPVPGKSAFVHRVLVADDSKDNAETLCLFLEMKGYEVRTANDGLEAIRIASQFLPDAVLLDIGMPMLDGYDTARRIRQETWGKDALIIAQSGWTQERDRERSVEAGFDAHLGKPLDLDELVTLLGVPRRDQAAKNRCTV